MVSLDMIRSEVEKRLGEDMNRKSVEVRADLLDDALADAAVQLQVRLRQVEYEVIEKGSSGVLGIGKRPWVIRASGMALQRASAEEPEDNLFGPDGLEEASVPVDADGKFYIRRFESNLMLKIVPPAGAGVPVSYRDVIQKLKRQDTVSLEENNIKRLVEEGTGGEYVPVGIFSHNRANDAVLVVDISEDGMYASITVSPPTAGGAEISPDYILRSLKTQGVMVGISQEKISSFVDNPVYGQPYIVSEGIVPSDGRDDYIA